MIPLTSEERRGAWRMYEDRGPDSLEANLRKLLKEYGLWGYHPRNSIGSEKGYPDWTILGPRGYQFVELKREGESPTREQRDVGGRLIAAGLNWTVWRPTDLLGGLVEDRLREIAARR